MAIALAIASSAKAMATPEGQVVFGEVGLLGEVRGVSFADRRLREAKKLGYGTIEISQRNLISLLKRLI